MPLKFHQGIREHEMVEIRCTIGIETLLGHDIICQIYFRARKCRKEALKNDVQTSSREGLIILWQVVTVVVSES